MKDSKKTKEQLINEMAKLGQQITELKEPEIKHKKTEEDLKKSQQEFTSLFKNIPDALVYTDEKGDILYINPCFTEVFGYTKKEILGKNIDKIGLYPKHKMKEGKDLTRKILNKDLSNFETVRQKKDGTPVPVRISTSFVKTKDAVTGIITLYQDITERKQNEKLQQVLYNISKATNSPISLEQLYPIIHKELGNIIDTTNFFIALVDYKRNEIFFPYYIDEKSDVSSASKLAKYSIYLNTPTSYVIKTGQPLLFDFQKLNQMIAQGKLKPKGAVSDKSIWLGVPLKMGDKTIGAMTVQSYTNSTLYSERDIKILEFASFQVAMAIQCKRTEETLQKSQQEFISLFRNSPEALVYVDEKSNILDINSQFTKLFGYTLEEVKGININDGMIHPQDKMGEAKDLYQKSLSGSFYNYESMRKKKDGFLFPVSISCSPVVIGGRTKGRIVSYQDITERGKMIDDLKNSEEKYRSLYENMPGVYYRADREGNILMANPPGAKLLGYNSPEEIIGKNIAKDLYYIPEDRKKFLEELKKREGVVKDYEVTIKRRDGTPVTVSTSSHYYYDEKGNIAGVEGIFIDITERKKAEEELRQSEEKFAGIFKNIPDAACYQDREGTILDINPRFTEVFGYTKEDILGKNIDEINLYPKGKTKEGKDLTHKTLHENLTNFETVRQKKDGTPVPVRISTSFVKIRDKVTGLIALYQNITERKEAEKALRKSHQEFASLFESCPEALVYLDEKGDILNTNPCFTELFGYTLEETKGRSIYDGMIHPLNKIEEGKGLVKLALSKGYLNYETIRKKKDGTLFPVSISASNIVIDGETKGTLGTYIDITERKQNEKLHAVLYNISKAANSPISLNQFYKTIHKELGTIIDTNNFYIALVDETEDKIFFPYNIDSTKPIHLPRTINHNSLVAQVIRTGKPIFVNQKMIKVKKFIGEFKEWFGMLRKAWLGAPLKVKDKVIGAMAVQSYTNSKLYSEKDIKIMEFVSNQIATAIERKRMEEELKKLAHYDTLTGAYNRGYGLELLQRQLKLSKRDKSPLLLAYSDLDNLKDINDEFGHDEGDRAMVQVAKLFKSILREVDIITRMGGDEFLVIFLDSSLNEIPIIRKRLSKELARLNQISKIPYKIDFSTGFSNYDPTNPLPMTELIRIADKKMYEEKKSKNKGR